MVNVVSTKEALAVEFSSMGNYIGLFSDLAATTEASGGGYARQQTTWSAGAADGQVAGSLVSVPVAAGTYYWAGVFSAATGGTLIDRVKIGTGDTGIQISTNGKIEITPTISVT